MTSRPKPKPTLYNGDMFRRRDHERTSQEGYGAAAYSTEPKTPTSHEHRGRLPRFNHNGHEVTRGIKPAGESGRRGIHPLHFFKIVFRSTSTASKYVNLLWPFVPAAIVLHFVRPEERLWIFILSYIAMIPAANLIGFAGQELARKLPTVLGVILETTLGSVVEIVLFMVLITGGVGNVPIIQAAILGSILANLLLCLGLCFFVGGIQLHEQEFHEAVSEVGSNLMLVAGMGLVIPTIFYTALERRYENDPDGLLNRTENVSRAAAFILIIAYVVYVFFQTRSHHGLYDDILEADEERDRDRHRDLAKDKLTLTECIIALALALTFVSMMAVFLVQNIEYLVTERHVPDAFLGLILVPLVEKAAEHLTAIDEAWDNQANFALSHVLGASIQTALLNTPLVVFVGWGLGNHMTLNFELFHAVVLILAILVVGGFLRDGKSNYLEGVLCFLIYVLIAVCAFYYPNPVHAGETASSEGAAGVEKRWS